MNLAICGRLSLAQDVKSGFQNAGVECNFFVTDFLLPEPAGGVWRKSKRVLSR